MKTIFRKLRWDLLYRGKTRKYLKYAIGEIVLVVIGILIALSINNWNENRKNKAAEQQLLNSLLLEFEDNLIILDSTIVTNAEIAETCIKIGEFTGPTLPTISEKELSQYMVGAFKYESRYIPNQGTLSEINNSGKLSLLSDKLLRRSISEWQSQYELVKNQETYVVTMRDNTHNYFINNGNFRRHLDLIDDALVDVKPSRFANNDFAFLTNPKFESNLYLFIVASINLNKTFYLPLKAKTETIIEQLKQNIKG
ncbi:DUF6090 family protein [Robertkochia solimangrovi]|uniref:DUF6090 family protein n=1 Tax=Robertkochia solimangrovi TaxID=2213046 RepID=UPI00117CBE94|nr:DUF6090 family protein [Robertkochia solimangrovi]TRZ42212.1 hypothetical protein DMZ48_14375 [Robertkochia solimangrovi]